MNNLILFYLVTEQTVLRFIYLKNKLRIYLDYAT